MHPMTSTSNEQRTFRVADLGTLAVLAWSGEHPEDEKDMAFLLAYSLGDTEGGPEATAEAMRTLLRDEGLPLGGPVLDGARTPSLPVGLLVEGEQAVVNMPHVKAQCVVPPEWLAAVRARGHAYFMLTTRAWPEGKPGSPVKEEALRDFAGSEETLLNAAHCLLPVRRLRG
ncbi:hypothetical protein STRAU_6539 [Streptomyces aurantiacus JA 4570]|uniref:Uncharacterized protein n=2 Tax=Streptomyces aurantiacus TaxID=47760 RepID=S3ZPV5_9ACTN|nr:hypothetical protein STRAU_6539 [Streptomyces aurantiacus JA 4570]